MGTCNFLSIDIGATSGRALLFTTDGATIEMEELYRFPNAIMELHGGYYWDVYQLYEHIKKGMAICSKRGVEITSIGIDTWGVDFGYIAEDGSLLALPHAYRDPYTAGVPAALFEKVSAQTVYGKTGIQTLDFNSIFQLYSAKERGESALANADKILFIPDLLSYLLTKKAVCEYTIASTSQMLNITTKEFDKELMEAIGISPDILLDPIEPGTQIGVLTEALAAEVELPQLPVVAVAGHDTASAIVAVPAKDPNFAYLSSGTWSLMGIETDTPILSEDSFKYNFTNEGGIEGTSRFLKNITGMWILEQCRKEWAKDGVDYSYPEIIAMAKDAEYFTSLINPDDPSFANPKSMIEAIKAYCEQSGSPAPKEPKEIMRCVFSSLANRYKEVLTMLQDMAPFKIEKLYVIGGGAQNDFLNQLTADAIGMPVLAGPSEATAIGNAMIQAKAAGIVKDRWEIRELVAKTYPSKEFLPKTK